MKLEMIQEGNESDCWSLRAAEWIQIMLNGVQLVQKIGEKVQLVKSALAQAGNQIRQ